MKTIVIEVAPDGSTVDLVLKRSVQSGQAVLVLSDNVEIKSKYENLSGQGKGFRAFVSENGFPPDKLTEEMIVQILRERGDQSRFARMTGTSMMRSQRGSEFQVKRARGSLQAANQLGDPGSVTLGSI